jgi:hypothetical protein
MWKEAVDALYYRVDSGVCLEGLSVTPQSG